MAIQPHSDPHLGRTLGGQYRIEALIGTGGMGRVYRGVQLSVKRPVAIKLIAGGAPHPPEWVERFRREAEATARLSHPNTVRLFDFGVTEAEELYMVMELLEGETLATHLGVHGPLPLPAALSITRQVLLALTEAHALGIVHRDIKPDNVFLAHVRGGDVVAKVMDFGIAGLQGVSTRLTGTGVVIGTPAYMSPEQAQGRGVSAQSDLYSLGVVLFEMLTGKPVFECNTPLPLLLLHVNEPPKPLIEVGVHVPQQARVQALLDGLLAKEPGTRPSTRTVLSRVEELSGTGLSTPVVSGTQLARPRTTTPPRSAAESGAILIPKPAAPPAVQAESTFHVPARFPWWLVGLGSLVLAAAAGLALRSLPGLRERIASKPAASAPLVAAATLHNVTITSAPEGAGVFLGARELGKTPYVFYFQEPTELTLAERGYERRTLRVTADSPATVVVSLQRETTTKIESARMPPRAAGVRPAAERGRVAPSALVVSEPPPEPEPEAQADEPVVVPQAPRVDAVPERDAARDIAERFAEYRQRAQEASDEREAATAAQDRTVPLAREPSSAEADEAAEAESHVRGHGLRTFGRILARAVGKVLIPYPDRARREALAGQPLRYLSFREAKRAHDADELDRVGFQEAVWQLRERRRHGIEEARERYARGELTQGQYEARVDQVWAEFWGR